MSTTINLGIIFTGKEIPALESIPCMGDFANPLTPKPNPRHVFPAWAGRALPAWWSMPSSLGGGLYICGPSGCGKSSSIREWCARTGTPMYAVTANGRLEFPDLVGHVSLESDGNGGTRTAFVYGPLSLAMKNGGLFLLDELDAYNAIRLDGGTSTSMCYDDEVVREAEPAETEDTGMQNNN